MNAKQRIAVRAELERYFGSLLDNANMNIERECLIETALEGIVRAVNSAAPSRLFIPPDVLEATLNIINATPPPTSGSADLAKACVNAYAAWLDANMMAEGSDGNRALAWSLSAAVAVHTLIWGKEDALDRCALIVAGRISQEASETWLPALRKTYGV